MRKERGDVKREERGDVKRKERGEVIERSINPCVEPSTQMVSGDLNYTMSPLFGES